MHPIFVSLLQIPVGASCILLDKLERVCGRLTLIDCVYLASSEKRPQIELTLRLAQFKTNLAPSYLTCTRVKKAGVHSQFGATAAVQDEHS